MKRTDIKVGETYYGYDTSRRQVTEIIGDTVHYRLPISGTVATCTLLEFANYAKERYIPLETRMRERDAELAKADKAKLAEQGKNDA